ncbi:flavin reductase family protein [Rhodococcus sp. 27YEA15]|uniref:flavin reductase family protein n=1 Tax=Rhodococcus sp. 27YEA15 TaxID=3156259 RepID=UPI003C7B9CE8
MAHVCSPVAVITAMDGDRPHGTTVSAFMSLSMDPPLALIALDRGSEVLALIEGSGKFAINVLAAEDGPLAMTFAKKGRDKFGGVGWQQHSGVPRLDGAPIWIACAVDSVADGGDHKIVTGAVVDVDHRESGPLTYHRRLFGTHLPSTV